MCKFKELTGILGYTYLDRFFEKLSYNLSESINKNVSAKATLSQLSDEMCFSDDGYLYFLLENEFPLDDDEDLVFKLEKIEKTNTYELHIDNEPYSKVMSLSSDLKSCVEDFFM